VAPPRIVIKSRMLVETMKAMGRLLIRGALGVFFFALALPALAVFSLAAMYADKRMVGEVAANQ
jgi:hypothetical protein